MSILSVGGRARPNDGLMVPCIPWTAAVRLDSLMNSGSDVGTLLDNKSGLISRSGSLMRVDGRGITSLFLMLACCLVNREGRSVRGW